MTTPTPTPTSTQRDLGAALLPVLGLPYHRVSSDEQERDGVSLPAQMDQTKRYMAALGWQIGGPYTDVLTGKRDDRRDYQRLLSDIRRYRKEGRRVAVVVSRLDRLGRRLLERVRSREEFKQLGVPTHSVREGGEVSDLTAGMLAVMAQEEVERLAARVSDSIQYTRSKGFAGGTRLPWGYRWAEATAAQRALGSFKTVLDIDEAEAPYVREAFARAAAGESVHAVARWASNLPHQARGGRTLSYPTVLRLLKNPVYIARQPLDRTEQALGRRLEASEVQAILATPAQQWPALVAEDVWAAAQARIAGHGRVPRQGGKTDYLLSGLLFCPRCGARMSGSSAGIKKTAPDGTVARYVARRYRCGATKQGPGAGQTCRYEVHAPSLEADTVRQVSDLLAAVTAAAKGRRGLDGQWERIRQPRPTKGNDGRRLAQLDAEMTMHREVVVGATAKFAIDQIDKANYDLVCQRAQEELARLGQQRLEVLAESRATAAPVLPPLATVLASLPGPQGWQAVVEAALNTSSEETDTSDAEAAGAAEARREARGQLTALIDRIVPHKAGYARSVAAVEWSALGEALRAIAA